MKPSIHKGRETPFLLAAAAALFLAACCYLGAALYGVLAALPEARTLPAAAAGDTLHGLAVRQESAVEAVPGARDGERITGEGVYFSACVGRESLSPPMFTSSSTSCRRERFSASREMASSRARLSTPACASRAFPGRCPRG